MGVGSGMQVCSGLYLGCVCGVYKCVWCACSVRCDVHEVCVQCVCGVAWVVGVVCIGVVDTVSAGVCVRWWYLCSL